MKYLILFVLSVLVIPLVSFSQAPVNYNDVGLIINENDTNSVAIGEYFIQQRNIPSRNVIRITAPTKETITFDEFQAVRAQIEDYLISSALRDSLNYLVTTKGVPLRITHGTGDDPRNASFDAEIMLILGSFAPHIGQNTLFAPPNSVRVHYYFRKDEPYRRKAVVPGTNPPLTYDLYLTTRLIGLTKEDVFALIDRSGPFTLVDKDSAKFVFDRDPRPIQLVPYDTNMAIAGSMLAARGWNVLVNHDSVFVTGERNVLGYTSWGSNDHFDHLFTQHARPKFHWLPGSLAETYVSTSARNFTPGQTSGQSRIADLIAEGCVGASGYVFEPYTVALTWVDVLFERYTRGYNLAESFYMANPTFSWMAVIVGDPKTSIITEMPPHPAPTAHATDAVCTGMPVTLTADNTLDGHKRWFDGDSSDVIAMGLPFDETHPLWIGNGDTQIHTPSVAGQRHYSFFNENFIGAAWAQTSVNVVEGLTLSIEISADSLFLDEDARVSVEATDDGAASWEWTFGDGGSASGRQAEHTYTTPGNYSITCTASNGPCTANASKEVVVMQTRPSIRSAENPVAFGETPIQSELEKQITIVNGYPSVTQVLSLSIEGLHAADFSIRHASLPAVVPGYGQFAFMATFTPSEHGEREAVLLVQLTTQATPLRIELRGIGTEIQTTVTDLAGINALTLYSNYPNPATDIMYIPFSLRESAHLRLTVYDESGRRIATLLDSHRAPGLHSVSWNTANIDSGKYMLILESALQRVTQRVSIVR